MGARDSTDLVKPRDGVCENAPVCARGPEEVLATGLTAGELAAILATSVLVFLFWDGPLWSAPAGATYVLRIGVSYAIAIPLAAGALARASRLSAARVAASVAVVWTAKLVITSTLYVALATETGRTYTPIRTWEHAAPPSPHPG